MGSEAVKEDVFKIERRLRNCDVTVTKQKIHSFNLLFHCKDQHAIKSILANTGHACWIFKNHLTYLLGTCVPNTCEGYKEKRRELHFERSLRNSNVVFSIHKRRRKNILYLRLNKQNKVFALKKYSLVKLTCKCMKHKQPTTKPVLF